MNTTEVLLIVVGAGAVGTAVYFVATRNKAPAAAPSQPVYQAPVYQPPPPAYVPPPSVSRPPAPANPLGDLVKGIGDIFNTGKSIFSGIQSIFG
ncbi:hypothetical protein [Archangium sp. Cb G35]|uniref:hypothetical protein n=1 Tax=Archangium sp. Cb G35 TaxID=1920190 RepID=UPI000B332740|nr:hypothetical protein [Archangium sp. Cb G35]